MPMVDAQTPVYRPLASAGARRSTMVITELKKRTSPISPQDRRGRVCGEAAVDDEVAAHAGAQGE